MTTKKTATTRVYVREPRPNYFKDEYYVHVPEGMTATFTWNDESGAYKVTLKKTVKEEDIWPYRK